MKSLQYVHNKLHTINTLLLIVAMLKYKGKKIVLTNGCFDIIHQGHLQSLHQAAAYGDYLVVALNTDASVKRLKGDTRPINNEQSRSIVMANLIPVDAVLLFDDDTPLQLIKTLLPDVLVKGGDYTIDQIVGAKEVLANGGVVEIIPILAGFSTTAIINKMH